MTSEQVEAAVSATGHVVVRADDPESVAEQAAERLGAELVFSVDELEAAITERLATIARRNAAREALDLHAEASDPRRHDHVEILDVDGLRRLVARLDAAHHLVGATRSDMRDRVGEATGLAVHPDTIRASAREVTSARADVERLTAEVEAAEAEWRSGLGSFGPDDDLAGLDDFAAEGDDDWDDRGRSRSVLGAVLMVVGAGVVAAALFVAGLGPVAFALPVVALVVASVIVWRGRGDDAGRDLASENLAAVSSMTSQAYGGAVEPSPPAAVHALQLQRDAAADRVRYAENAWRGLVGPDVDVDDVDEVIRSRDPRTRVADAELDNTPAVRTAQRHVRRLEAQWKLVWWVLDQPRPDTDRAAEAIDALVADGLDRVVAPTHAGRQSQARARERVDEVLGGRSVDELQTEADVQPTSVVALDLEGALTEDDVVTRAASLGGDARVVVVAPSGD